MRDCPSERGGRNHGVRYFPHRADNPVRELGIGQALATAGVEGAICGFRVLAAAQAGRRYEGKSACVLAKAAFRPASNPQLAPPRHTASAAELSWSDARLYDAERTGPVAEGACAARGCNPVYGCAGRPLRTAAPIHGPGGHHYRDALAQRAQAQRVPAMYWILPQSRGVAGKFIGQSIGSFAARSN